jgi:hypothetical protein
MRIGRTIIIPAIIALAAAGAILAGSEISPAAVHASVSRVEATALYASPDALYHN